MSEIDVMGITLGILVIIAEVVIILTPVVLIGMLAWKIVRTVGPVLIDLCEFIWECICGVYEAICDGFSNTWGRILSILSVMTIILSVYTFINRVFFNRTLAFDADILNIAGNIVKFIVLIGDAFGWTGIIVLIIINGLIYAIASLLIEALINSIADIFSRCEEEDCDYEEDYVFGFEEEEEEEDNSDFEQKADEYKKNEQGYFAGCRSAEELKKRFKKLAKELHPDNGGDVDKFNRMKAEYDKCLAVI